MAIKMEPTSFSLSSIAADLGGEDIVANLSLDSKLQKLYDADAGVSEGYTIGEHSIMVVNRALKHREYIEEKLRSCEPFDIHLFTLFLAIHDIGKGPAMKDYAQNPTHYTSRKNAEIIFTQRVLTDLPPVGLNTGQIKIIKEMLSQDAIGELLRRKISPFEAASILKKAADKAEMCALKFFNLMNLYHNCDSGSYPMLCKRIFIDKGMERIESHCKLLNVVQMCLSNFPTSKL